MGDTLCIVNPVKAWWGEGDEKIYVDGEAFPSHFVAPIMQFFKPLLLLLASSTFALGDINDLNAMVAYLDTLLLEDLARGR